MSAADAAAHEGSDVRFRVATNPDGEVVLSLYSGKVGAVDADVLTEFLEERDINLVDAGGALVAAGDVLLAAICKGIQRNAARRGGPASGTVHTLFVPDNSITYARPALSAPAR
jgi:hypothetical protein